eukprot:gb/GECG01010275.1/.p1 GENE.gb/GECG01010275.1/~~gb/GECG01010275.1/.p1  ORF type:complete len:117 (+),score=10.15 gb/GECG01010275.1/:1-351(+)
MVSNPCSTCRIAVVVAHSKVLGRVIKEAGFYISSIAENDLNVFLLGLGLDIIQTGVLTQIGSYLDYFDGREVLLELLDCWQWFTVLISGKQQKLRLPSVLTRLIQCVILNCGDNEV